MANAPKPLRARWMAVAALAAVLLLLPELSGIETAIARPQQPAPMARVKLETDRAEYLLGENIHLLWGLVNDGAEPLGFCLGGDTRGTLSLRPLRFKVEATNEQGDLVPHLAPRRFCMGGALYGHAVAPGQTWWGSLELTRYVDFRKPGVYRIRVYHDLGWDDLPAGHKLDPWIPTASARAPIGEITLRLKMPDAQQARAVVEEMLTQSALQFPYTEPGEKRPHAVDFISLRLPVYLPLLAELAAREDGRVIAPLCFMFSTEATRVLIRLGGSRDPELARDARQTISERIPWTGLEDQELSRREQAWSKDLGPLLLSHARKWLAGEDLDRTAFAASALGQFGESVDLHLLLARLDQLLDAAPPAPGWGRDLPAAARRRLVHAAWSLFERGAPLLNGPASDARTLVLLRGIRAPGDSVPPSMRREIVGKALEIVVPEVLIEALRVVPLPLDAAVFAQVLELLGDAAGEVRREVCRLAARSGDPRFRDPLTKLLGKTEDPLLLVAACPAATACGIPRDESLEMCIRRLDEPEMTKRLDRFLRDDLLEYGDGDGYPEIDWATDAAGLKVGWQRFLDENRKAIRSGERIAVDDPSVGDDLLAPGQRIYKDDRR